MTIETALLITFSPTRTSRKTGEAILEGLNMPQAETVDFSYTDCRVPLVPATAVAVFSAPVYGGHVAPAALKRMAAVRGDGTPAIVTVVYGNRDYEKALAELAGFATTRGFKVIAAATMVGEHSFSNHRFPIAAGRPNAADLDFARGFGAEIRAKLEAAPSADVLNPVDVRRMERPGHTFGPGLRLIAGALANAGKIAKAPKTPSTDPTVCTRCGQCVAHCPAAAIRISDGHVLTATDRCIKCCACVKYCPTNARTFKTPFARLLSQNFHKPKENKRLI